MRAARRIVSWTSTTTPTPRITLSRLRRSKPYPWTIDSILQLSPKSYEVRWTEQGRDLNGAATGAPSHWEAELETEIMPPARPITIVSNPLGFYVDQISWTQAAELETRNQTALGGAGP